MSTPVVLARTVARVTTKRRLGADAQVDAKALVFAPQDPALTDPFLALMEDEFSSRGFEWHPHRGLETVTTVLDGVLEHGDSLGNRGALQAGDVQWMTAGRGIIHRELAYRNERAHTLQLWVNLPRQKKMTATRYQDVLVRGRPRLDRAGASVEVVAGTVGGVRGRARTHSPITGAVLALEPGASYEHDVPADHRLFAHVLGGEVQIAGRSVRAGQTAWVDPAGRDSTPTALSFSVPDRDRPARVMVYSGRPLREPVAMGGPFVMSSRRELEQAYRDFEAGKFGQVPRQARLKHVR